MKKSKRTPIFEIISLIHLLIGYGQCRILFDHPDLVSHYLHLRRSTSSDNSRIPACPFSRSGITNVYNFCLNVVQNNKFIILRSDEPMRRTDSQVMETTFNRSSIVLNTVSDSIVVDETIDVPGIEGGVNVIRCATVNGRSLYIENGSNKQYEYFIFKEIDDLKRYKIELSLFVPYNMWLLGPGRIMLTKSETYSPLLFRHIRRFEIEFRKSQIKIAGREKRDICQLQGMDRLKICSMMHQLLIANSSPPFRTIKHYIRDQSTYDDCKQNVHVKFMDPADEALFESSENHHTVDLVPCAVNSEWDKPTFYVAADQCNRLGAYVFSSLVGQPGQYTVLMRLKTIHLFNKYPPFGRPYTT